MFFCSCSMMYCDGDIGIQQLMKAKLIVLYKKN